MSSKAAGQNAMKHARALCAASYANAPTIEAQKTVIWIPDKKNPTKRTPISRPEDVFGVFDLVVFRSWVSMERDLCLQITTHNPSTHGGRASERRTKIRELFIRRYKMRGIEGRPDLWVLAWERSRYFHAWKWEWGFDCWGAAGIILSPEIKRAPEIPAGKTEVVL